MYPILTEKEEWLGKQIVDAAYKVHKELGPGLLEKNYEACLCVVVDELVICELKAVETINPLWKAQIISHLKLTKLRLGYLINFNVRYIRDGIKRYVN